MQVPCLIMNFRPYVSQSQLLLPSPLYLTTFVFRSLFTEKFQTAVIFLFLKLEEKCLSLCEFCHRSDHQDGDMQKFQLSVMCQTHT